MPPKSSPRGRPSVRYHTCLTKTPQSGNKQAPASVTTSMPVLRQLAMLALCVAAVLSLCQRAEAMVCEPEVQGPAQASSPGPSWDISADAERGLCSLLSSEFCDLTRPDGQPMPPQPELAKRPLAATSAAFVPPCPSVRRLALHSERPAPKLPDYLHELFRPPQP